MRRVAAPLVLVLAGLGLTACSDAAASRTDERYCTEVGTYLTDLAQPMISTPDDIERVLAVWRRVAASAPLAIEPEWEQVVDSFETAATVVAGDEASLQLAADTARAAEPAADRVITYTQQVCGATIGVAPPAP